MGQITRKNLGVGGIDHIFFVCGGGGGPFILFRLKRWPNFKKFLKIGWGKKVKIRVKVFFWVE